MARLLDADGQEATVGKSQAGQAGCAECVPLHADQGYWLDSDDFVSTADLDAEHLGKASQHMAHATSATSAFCANLSCFRTGWISERLARCLWLQQGAEAISWQEGEVCRKEGPLVAANSQKR